MKKLLILSLLFSCANAFAWGCNETKAGDRLIERVEKIRDDCAALIEKKYESSSNHFEGAISSCALEAKITIMESIKFEDGENPTQREMAEANDIVDRYETDIKRQLGVL